MSAVGGSWNQVLVAASSYVHYSGSGNAYASSGVGITEFSSDFGTYSITWTDGSLKCNQSVNIKE